MMSEAQIKEDKASAPTTTPATVLEQAADTVEPYSAFSATKRQAITLLLSVAALVSPLTATIYLPLLPPLAAHFSTSIQAINLTITLYIIFQALAPLLLSTHSDTLGRRPIYLATFALYTIASLGLALNRSSYPALLILRAVQSLGASAVLSICYGTVADVSPSSSRGRILGPMMASSNLGTAIGPVLGGWITYSSGSVWWAFWGLVIFGAAMLAQLVSFMPETARNVVGNGSISDRRWNRPLIELLTSRCGVRQSTDHGGNRDAVSGQRELAGPTRKFHFASPFISVRMMFHPDTALILWIVGCFYALWYTVQASIPLTFRAEPYRFNELQIGLAYLPGALGVVLCMYLTGKAMDHNYRVLAARQRSSDYGAGNSDSTDTEQATHQHQQNKDIPIDEFPIERARSRFTPPLLLLSLIATVGYGWALHTRVHAAVGLVLQFLMGFLATWILNMFNALLVDGFPEAPAAAATAGNLVRCGFSAGAVAALQPLTQKIGQGWFFTMVGILSGAAGLVATCVLNEKGMGWRRKRSERRKNRDEKG